MPSQPQWSPACRFRCSQECRHSRGLAVQSLVSGEENRMNRTEGREFRPQSLLDEFSISEFRNETVHRPVAFPRRPVRSVGPGSGVAEAVLGVKLADESGKRASVWKSII